MRERRTEVINFKEFMDGSWKEKPRKKKDMRVNSFMPVPTFSLFFNEPILGLLGIGAVVVIGTVWEKRLVQKGKHEEAEVIATVLGIGLPVVGVVGSMLVLYKAFNSFL